MQQEINIIPYEQQYEAQVIELILGIQQGEYGIPITIEDQPDLNKISEVYQVRQGQFFIAQMQGQIVGTIGAIAISRQSIALRKMFVAKNYRGSAVGVASRLLHKMIDHAREHQIEAIYLGTVEEFKAAHRFYEKHRFIQIDAAQLPQTFPRMKVDTRFYKLDL